MEYMQTDLKTVLDKAIHVQMSQDHATILIHKLLCALNFIHSANVVHRDIKPANILIDDNCNLRLCDFGLARTLPKLESKHYDLKKEEISDRLLKNKSRRCKKIRDLSNHVQ